MKEELYGCTQEEIFSAKRIQEIRKLEIDTVLSFQLELLFKQLDFLNSQTEELTDKIKESAEPHMREIEILTSMKGISVFTAIAIIDDILKN